MMPKRRAGGAATPEISPRMRRHLGDLERRSVADYFVWCRVRGFETTLDKSAYDREAERLAFVFERDHAAAVARVTANTALLIEKACAGTIAARDIARPQLQLFCGAIEKSDPVPAARDSLRDLLRTVNAKADFLLEGTSFGGQSYRYVDALIKLNDRRAQWLRPFGTWRAASHNGARQFSSLARHLLARFPVPEFMDQAWLRADHGAHKFRDWFIHLGAGKNIRAANTPIPMTKLMAHHFLEAPRTFTIEGAIRWGQVHALGGDRLLTEAVIGSGLGHGFDDDDFWTTVIRFFITNPMLDRRHVGPIVDYLTDQKFITREVVTGPGQVEIRPPPQPGLTMRGRTAESLLAQVERWHEELGRARGAENLYFRRSGHKGLEISAGREGKERWIIRELLSGADLVAEGKSMRHCVASYAHSCAKGACSIWAMEFRADDKTEKRQTIEVRSGTIVQCRGKQNRLPTQSEFEVVGKWARAAGLTIGSYVRAGG